MCMSGEVEDEKHFVLDCLRKKMFDVVKRVMLKKREEIEDVMKSEIGRQRIFGALMGVESRTVRRELSYATWRLSLARQR